jgi:hypothetical protein
VLLDDANTALKKNDTQGAIVHLELVKKQLISTTITSPAVKEPTPTIAGSQISNVQANHSPVAYDDTADVTSGSEVHIKLRAIDSDS